MKIKLRYESSIITYEIDESEFTLMIQTDYEERCAKADDPKAVSPRSPQEIIDERFNKPDYNNVHKQHRHTDPDFRIRKLSGKRGAIPTDSTDEDYGSGADCMDMLPDTKGARARKHRENYADVCEYLRKHMKPEDAAVIIAVRLDGMSCIEYGNAIGENGNTVNHRLRRAEKKLKKIWETCPF